jgi:hypothetical protein
LLARMTAAALFGLGGPRTRGCEFRLWKTCLLLALALMGSAPLRAEMAPGSINTLNDLFIALQACWQPPPLEQARDGMELTVRFSLTRFGRILGKATITFETRDASDDERLAYRKAVAQALERCTPFPLTDALGGAIAGRPLAIRFIDTRKQKGANTVTSPAPTGSRCPRLSASTFCSVSAWKACIGQRPSCTGLDINF